MLDRDSKFKLAGIIAISALMAGVFLSLTTPVSSPDFWWHLATGKWIWQQGSLMTEDPFNFMAFPEESSLRRTFILKQYWLAQILFYLINLAGGLKGLIVLRAMTLTLMFLGAYRLMRNAGAGIAVSAAFVFISWWVIVREIGYIELRPQMFSSLFAVCLVLVLEELRRDRRWAFYALPALMMLWSNMHGGFALGIGIIGIYAIGMAIRGEGNRACYISLVSAMLLSLLNPNGYNAFLMLAAPFLDPGAGDYLGGVVEHKSLFGYSGIGGVMRRLPVFSSLMLLSSASFIALIPEIKKVRIELVMLYIVLFAMAVSGVRYVVFFATIGPFIAAVNTAGVSGRLWQRASGLRHAGTIGVAISFLLVMGMAGYALTESVRTTALKNPMPYMNEYGPAIDFMKRNNITGRIFNDYAPGGFLIWSLYPGSEVFMDGRRLFLKGSETGRLALDNPFYREPGAYGPPLYKKLSEEYAIEAAILPGCDRVSGVLIRLTLALIQDSRWHVVYADSSAIVLIKETPGTMEFIAKNRLLKRAGFRNILSMAEAAGNSYYGNVMPGRKLSMAVGLWGTGQYDEALKWLSAYTKQVPQDPLAEYVSNDLREQIGRMRQISPSSSKDN